MSEITGDDKKFLLQLARAVITDRLMGKTSLSFPEDISSALKEKKGCFVTLLKKGRLRGCIGTIEPEKPLFSGVKENALHAAFDDYRFSPMTREEMDDTSIEVSVLTKPQKLDFRNEEDLKTKIRPGIHGMILERKNHRATFLPQVWKQLPKTEDFLSSLCLKAGMEKTCWKDLQTTVYIYEVEHFSEEEILSIQPTLPS